MGASVLSEWRYHTARRAGLPSSGAWMSGHRPSTLFDVLRKRRVRKNIVLNVDATLTVQGNSKSANVRWGKSAVWASQVSVLAPILCWLDVETDATGIRCNIELLNALHSR